MSGKELFQLEPGGTISRKDRSDRRVAVKRVWYAIVKCYKGLSWNPDSALKVELSLKEVETALARGRTGLPDNLKEYEMNAFIETLDAWRRRRR